ncbi:MAG: dihydrodipicolinate synthase family protein [Candidatus Marinimicrobia bacterium]|nr:dihydrodipicolinate synthase family protein [Candidatus Neomarinimicrobiota bacterium]
MKKNNFYGMMPILPTAISPDGKIDEKSMRRLVQYCIKFNAAAIGHFGFASEFHKISDTDRRVLTEIIVDETAGSVPVFIGINSQGFNISLRYAEEAEKLGADIIMAALPLINLPTREEAYNLYKDISSTSSLPIIIQDIPESANVLSPDLVWEMYQEIENVKYVKAEGTGFISKTQEIINLSKGELEVIGGAGGKSMIHLLRMGITSFMTGTEALDFHNGTVQAFLDGDEEKAADIYYNKIMPYFAFYDNYPEELLKAMLKERGIIDHPDIIAPSAKQPMSEIEWREFNWILDRIGFRKKWPNIS